MYVNTYPPDAGMPRHKEKITQTGEWKASEGFSKSTKHISMAYLACENLLAFN